MQKKARVKQINKEKVNYQKLGFHHGMSDFHDVRWVVGARDAAQLSLCVLTS